VKKFKQEEYSRKHILTKSIFPFQKPFEVLKKTQIFVKIKKIYKTKKQQLFKE
jgi:hypothetical protein